MNSEVLDITCRQLKEAIGPESGGTLAIVHGAGSFGHFQANRAKVAHGNLGNPGASIGFVETRLSVTRLNHIVVQNLAGNGVPAVGVPPFAAQWCTTDSWYLLRWNTSIV